MEALDLIFKNDGLGYGDQIACCPKCGKPFCLPFKYVFSNKKPPAYPCEKCGQLIKLN